MDDVVDKSGGQMSMYLSLDFVFIYPPNHFVGFILKVAVSRTDPKRNKIRWCYIYYFIVEMLFMMFYLYLNLRHIISTLMHLGSLSPRRLLCHQQLQAGGSVTCQSSWQQT